MDTRVLGLAAMIAIAPMPGVADGMRVEDGRYAGGPVTTLRVEADQLASWPDERWIALTRTQQEAVRADTGIAPAKVFLYDAREGESDCTCHAWNVGFLFREDGFDVPHPFVVTNEEAAERQAEFDAFNR